MENPHRTAPQAWVIGAFPLGLFILPFLYQLTEESRKTGWRYPLKF